MTRLEEASECFSGKATDLVPEHTSDFGSRLLSHVGHLVHAAGGQRVLDGPRGLHGVLGTLFLLVDKVPRSRNGISLLNTLTLAIESSLVDSR